ncbi:MAG: hypothetical protein K2W95_15635 [Candidatus Obscuribacterales bacterium]|nr:hypothetical protein [Candidatus Obscuribacterales bacterium]
MKPVFQTVKHNPPHAYGNCYRACIASILEIDIDDIPPFETMGGFNDGGESGDEWWRVYTEWLAARGLLESRHPVEQGRVPKGYSILGGRSPRFPETGHCVVAKDGEIVHDPAGVGLEQIREFWDFGVLIPLDQELVECYPIRILDHYYDGEWSMRKDRK